MRYILFLWAALLVACSPGSESPPTQNSNTIAIINGQIIDGTGHAALTDGVVLVEGNKIKAVGATGNISIPDGAQTIDAKGQTVLPGLVDVHVHFDIIGHADYDHWFETYPPRMRKDIFPAAAKTMLHAGVTSVRDLGSDVENIFWLKEEINSGRLQGPRPFIAGPFLRKTVTSYVDKSYIDTWVINGADDAREKVRKLKSMGVDVIKTQDEELTSEELAAIFDEAEAQGLRTASHIYSPQGVEAALSAGMRDYATIEHIGDGNDPTYNQNVIDMILKQKVAMAPTIIALEGVQMIVDDPTLVDDPRWNEFIADDIFADIRASYLEADLSQHPIFLRNVDDRINRNKKLKQLSDVGAIFAISSDSGTRGNPHHNAMWREMVLTQQVTGKPSREIIHMATEINARILGQSKNLGTLEPGKLADIIIVDGDPLSDLSLMSQVDHVIKDGVVIK